VDALPFDDDDDDDRAPIPDLSRLPQEEWMDALRPLSRMDRIRAQQTLSYERVQAAMAINGILSVEDGIARSRAQARAARPGRMPIGDPPEIEDASRAGSRRQVNFRLSPREHARLVEAAQLYGMRPGMLARLLTVRGVDRALADARHDA
jgi:hypothetical protein